MAPGVGRRRPDPTLLPATAGVAVVGAGGAAHGIALSRGPRWDVVARGLVLVVVVAVALGHGFALLLTDGRRRANNSS